MDKNTSQEDAELLAKFIRSHHLFFLNLIPLNQVEGGMVPANPTQQKSFINYLNQSKIDYSLRRSFGQNFAAACGQLIAK
jgi:adenine C2-methylase RlmN of 23S rRNA A2503 and tRNA A37